jgi:hypothetical protein
MPTTVPTTSSPTISAPPSSSLAPSLTGNNEVSTDAELRDQIAVAEDGREWTLTVTDDFGVNRTFVIPRFKHFKVIGSSNLGRRARFTKSIVNSDPWDDDLCFKLHNFDRGQEEESSIGTYEGDFNALWLVNIELKGFPSYAIHGGERNTMTFVKCRFVENRGTTQNSALLVLGPNSAAFVRKRGCEFFDNAASLHGGGIQVGYVPTNLYAGAVVDVIDSVFARNTAPVEGAAVFVNPGNQRPTPS